jgi:elongation factor P--(R)-beta-lysine ligase
VTSQSLPWWSPATHADRQPFLAARGQIRSAVRDWFASERFIEVEPGCLQVSPGNEAHLHAFKAERIGTDLVAAPLYLNTSPEFAMKKLLAAGETRIYALQPCFRNREAGPLHASEFTMLEWYRAHTTHDAMMADCAQLVSLAARTTGARWVSYRGRTCDPHAEPERLSVAAAVSRHAGIDILATTGDRNALAVAADAQGIRVGDDYSWSDIFSRILTERVELNLGIGRATLLVDYPVSEAALAKVSARDPRVAERFELYVCGVEIANGFSELTDPALQRSRLEAEMDLKQARYGERYPIDDDFLGALAIMPEASGCALGFDRLVMLAAGAVRIDQVRWTPLA